MVESCERETCKQYQKVVYVLNLFETSEENLRKKVAEGRQIFLVSQECLDDYLKVQTHTHEPKTNITGR